MQAEFYCGTGAAGIAKAISFLGLSGGKSWEKSFSNHSPKLCKLITSVVNGVLKTRLVATIEAIIKEKIKCEKYTDYEIKKATNTFFKKAKKSTQVPS